MNPLIFFLVQTQTRTDATIIIITLLLVAGIIGYITGWLYYRSFLKRKIMVAGSETEKLNNQIARLNTNNSDLLENLREKGNETDYLQKEIDTLKALHAESVHEADEALVHIAKRKYLLDYHSIGKAEKTERDDLKMISGIGPFIEERLHALDIYTFRQISNFTPGDIEKLNIALEYFSGRIERDKWVAQARELVNAEENRINLLEQIRAKKTRIYFDRIGTAHKDNADELTLISGIGGWINQKLNALDIYTFKQISNFSDEDVHIVAEAIEYFPGRIERDEWILQAHELVRIEGKKAELLKRIRGRKNKVYYDRLGVAHKQHANNLTLINGIGLWIEERLNMLDIYTFDQVSNFTPSDVETISGILEISPERMDINNWVIQARRLKKDNSNVSKKTQKSS